MNSFLDKMFKMDIKPTVVTSQAFQVFDTTTEFKEPIPLQDDGVVQAQVKGNCKRVQKTSQKQKQTDSTLGGSMTITWFNSLCLSEMDSLLNFPESLLLVTESGSKVGKYYCSVKKSILNGEPCLLVHFGSCSVMQDGLECGTTVTGFIDFNLKTMQEFTHEWLKVGDKSLDRKFFLIREEDKKQYFCQNIVKEHGQVREDKSFALPLKDMNHVITETANIILQRIIIKQQKTGEIDLKALTFKGTIVRSNFCTLGCGFENIRGQEMKVWGVRRTIFEDKNIEEWDSIYNEHGRLVLRCQPDKDHALIPLWFKAVEEYAVTGEFIGTRPNLIWACDMELYAQYLERKDTLASHNKEYMLRNPQLQALLADFVQALLQKKPDKVIEFGMTYFEPFLNKQGEIHLSLSDSDADQSIHEEQEGEGEEYSDEFYTRYDYPTPPHSPHQEFGPKDYFDDHNFVKKFSNGNDQGQNL